MTTYATLKSDIAGWLLRDDLTAAIPSFIRLAEAAIRRDVRIRQMLKVSTLTLTGQSTPLPSDFMEMNRVALDSTTDPGISFMPAEALYSHDSYHDSGTPCLYTIEGTNIITAPDGTGEDLLLNYYRAFDALADAADTNWLLTNAYAVYLYGSLAHASPYIKEDERVGLWVQGYNSAVSALNKADRRSTFAGAPLAVRNGTGP